jgi:signal transduction histidine kinase
MGVLSRDPDVHAGRPVAVEPAQGANGPPCLWRMHRDLVGRALEGVLPTLDAAYGRATLVYDAGGRSAAADRLAACTYAAAVLIELAANGQLDASDTAIAAEALAAAADQPIEAAGLALYLRTVSSPALFELPPVVAAEIALRLVSHLDVTEELTLWRSAAGGAELLLATGHEPVSRRLRSTARAALRGRSTLSMVVGSPWESAQVLRFGEPYAVILGRPGRDPRRTRGFLRAAADAVGLMLEREHVLERGAARERVLVAAGEKRLMRVGFDLHDGPIQDVLTLGAEIREFREQLYPFVLDSHRDLARGRFDDLIARTVELDHQLRDMSHALESRSVVSRPLSEVLHRMVDAFRDRSGIATTIEVKGDPDILTAAQRIAVFRAIQESLANVREHAGATEVALTIRTRRSFTQVSITDNGAGFDVPRALARAAQRGRLGLVGIGERVRMLGGTFHIESAPGGPTTLTFTLPRWEQFTGVDGQG